MAHSTNSTFLEDTRTPRSPGVHVIGEIGGEPTTTAKRGAKTMVEDSSTISSGALGVCSFAPLAFFVLAFALDLPILAFVGLLVTLIISGMFAMHAMGSKKMPRFTTAIWVTSLVVAGPLAAPVYWWKYGRSDRSMRR